MKITGDNKNFSPTLIIKTAAISILILSTLLFWFDGIRSLVGVVSGGIIAIFNFIWLKSILFRALTPEAAAPVRFALFRSFTKFFLTAFSLYLLITTKTVSIIGLLAGLSTIVIAIITVLIINTARSEGDTP